MKSNLPNLQNSTGKNLGENPRETQPQNPLERLNEDLEDEDGSITKEKSETGKIAFKSTKATTSLSTTKFRVNKKMREIPDGATVQILEVINNNLKEELQQITEIVLSTIATIREEKAVDAQKFINRGETNSEILDWEA